MYRTFVRKSLPLLFQVDRLWWSVLFGNFSLSSLIILRTTPFRVSLPFSFCPVPSSSESITATKISSAIFGSSSIVALGSIACLVNAFLHNHLQIKFLLVTSCIENSIYFRRPGKNCSCSSFCCIWCLFTCSLCISCCLQHDFYSRILIIKVLALSIISWKKLALDIYKFYFHNNMNLPCLFLRQVICFLYLTFVLFEMIFR